MEKSNGKEQWKRAMEKSNGKEVEMFWFEYVILNRRDEIPFSLSPSQDLFIDNSCRFILPALPGLFSEPGMTCTPISVPLPGAGAIFQQRPLPSLTSSRNYCTSFREIPETPGFPDTVYRANIK